MEHTLVQHTAVEDILVGKGMLVDMLVPVDGMLAKNCVVEGIAVEGIAVERIAVEGIAVEGIAVAFLQRQRWEQWETKRGLFLYI